MGFELRAFDLSIPAGIGHLPREMRLRLLSSDSVVLLFGFHAHRPAHRHPPPNYHSRCFQLRTILPMAYSWDAGPTGFENCTLSDRSDFIFTR